MVAAPRRLSGPGPGRPRARTLTALAAAIVLNTPAGSLHAQQGAADDRLTVSGFGTAAAAFSTERQADFVGNLIQPNGAGHTANPSVGPDSKLGVQQQVDQSEGSRVRDQFYNQVVNKTPAQLKAYWSRAIFSGKAEPPWSEPDDSAVKRRLQRDASAIGYIDRESVDTTVRIIYPRHD